MEQILYFSLSAALLFFLITSLIRNFQQKRLIEKLESELMTVHKLNDEITGEVNKMANEPIEPDLIDHLTSLPGRKVFEDRLMYAIQQSGRQKSIFAVMCLDIDHLKDIDKVGANIGDKVLKELAARLQMSVRQVDTVTRYAGGCFYLLLPHLSRAETAIYVAQRVQDNLLQSFKIDGYELAVTVSIGIAVYPVDGVQPLQLIENAALAMRQAKTQGHNKYQFCQNDLQSLGQRELNLIHLIRSPELFNKLHVQFKPYFNAESNKVYYVQAIPHLRDSVVGMVPFSSFANIAENSGRILDIYQWLLRQSLTQCLQWAKEGFKPQFIAMPISLRQLENAHFIYTINEVMQEFKDNNVSLVLDIYDDKLPQNPIFIENLFTALNDAGIKVAVGVIALGHFAMQKINKIPLNYLKIDAKLIESAASFKDKELILNKIIELAKDENITVIAEGIDNETQKQRLQRLGCELMEGKVFGYLMPTGSVLEQ